jgi:hypothetical protein
VGGPPVNDAHGGPLLTPADNTTLCRAHGGINGNGNRTVPPPPPPPRASYRLLHSQRRRQSTGCSVANNIASTLQHKQCQDGTPRRQQSLGGVTNSVDRAIWTAANRALRKDQQLQQQQMEQLSRTNRQTGLYDYQLLLPHKLNEQLGQLGT